MIRRIDSKKGNIQQEDPNRLVLNKYLVECQLRTMAHEQTFYRFKSYGEMYLFLFNIEVD